MPHVKRRLGHGALSTGAGSLTGAEGERYALPMKRMIALWVGLLALVPLNAGATIMLKMELRDLVGRADQIFVGKVVKVESRGGENGRQIVTDTTFRVEQGVRGVSAGGEVVVRHLGGVVGGIGMKISGTPSFRVGDQALLFTDRRKNHRYVTGMNQGAFSIARDAAGQAMVRTDLSDLALARKNAQGGLEMIKKSRPAPERLDSFVRRIKETITRCEQEKNRCRSL